MATMAASLAKSLPKPRYTGHDEQLKDSHSRGPKVVGADGLHESQIALKSGAVPPYGQRTGWRPKHDEDFGDGGAFPEIHHVQYPLGMGKEKKQTSNALTLQIDGQGQVDYTAIAKRGHSSSRVVHSSFKDLVPVRHRADAGELSLDRPSAEDVEAAREKTQNALNALITGATASQNPKAVKGTTRAAPTYVSYTPDNQMGDKHGGKQRIIKIQERQQDPMEPPKHKAKKIPRGPPSPPPPVMHSPPRKLTAEDQANWKIPPSVSLWKNNKGYTRPLDKLLAADGRGLQDVSVNDNFAQFAEALQAADRHAREEVRQRATMQQKLAEKEKAQKEEHLRSLAQQAREDRAAAGGGGKRMTSRTSRSLSAGGSRSRSRSRSHSVSSRSDSQDEEEEARKERERMRRERKEENERQLRQSRMGTERRMQQMAREQNRDISEKVALGLAKPTQSAESMYDSRLFNQSSGFNTGFNEDQHYDKPLFASRDALNSIYRPNTNADDDGGEDGGETMEKIQGAKRFDVLGKAGKGFQGAEYAEAREGPVQFEKDAGDPFGVDQMIKEVTGGKRYGMQDPEEGRKSKKARVEDDE